MSIKSTLATPLNELMVGWRTYPNIYHLYVKEVLHLENIQNDLKLVYDFASLSKKMSEGINYPTPSVLRIHTLEIAASVDFSSWIQACCVWFADQHLDSNVYPCIHMEKFMPEIISLKTCPSLGSNLQPCTLMSNVLTIHWLDHVRYMVRQDQQHTPFHVQNDWKSVIFSWNITNYCLLWLKSD